MLINTRGEYVSFRFFFRKNYCHFNRTPNLYKNEKLIRYRRRLFLRFAVVCNKSKTLLAGHSRERSKCSWRSNYGFSARYEMHFWFYCLRPKYFPIRRLRKSCQQSFRRVGRPLFRVGRARVPTADRYNVCSRLFDHNAVYNYWRCT